MIGSLMYSFSFSLFFCFLFLFIFFILSVFSIIENVLSQDSFPVNILNYSTYKAIISNYKQVQYSILNSKKIAYFDIKILIKAIKLYTISNLNTKQSKVKSYCVSNLYPIIGFQFFGTKNLIFKIIFSPSFFSRLQSCIDIYYCI